jgi:hypothetical protein
VQANDKAKDPWVFVFYGDSTVEALRGTYLGNSWTMFSQGPGFWKTEMEHIPSGLLGIAGMTSIIRPQHDALHDPSEQISTMSQEKR